MANDTERPLPRITDIRPGGAPLTGSQQSAMYFQRKRRRASANIFMMRPKPQAGFTVTVTLNIH